MRVHRPRGRHRRRRVKVRLMDYFIASLFLFSLIVFLAQTLAIHLDRKSFFESPVKGAELDEYRHERTHSITLAGFVLASFFFGNSLGPSISEILFILGTSFSLFVVSSVFFEDRTKQKTYYLGLALQQAGLLSLLGGVALYLGPLALFGGLFVTLAFVTVLISSFKSNFQFWRISGE